MQRGNISNIALNMCNTTSKSWEHLIDEGMESEIARLIGSQDLKLHFVETCWKGGFTLK